MTQPAVVQLTTRTARILHGALFGGALTIAIALSAIRSSTGGVTDLPVMLLRYVTLGVLVIDLLVARTLRARLPRFTPPEGESEYWRANLSRAIVVWAVVESAVLFGAVVHFATGDWMPLAAAAVALAVLWGYRPGGMMGR